MVKKHSVTKHCSDFSLFEGNCSSDLKIFSNLNSNFPDLLYLRNFQEQVKKSFCYQKLFWPFTVWTNCSSDLKIFANSWPSASNFKFFSRSLEQFFLTVGQNNFGNKIPLLWRFRKGFGPIMNRHTGTTFQRSWSLPRNKLQAEKKEMQQQHC